MREEQSPRGLCNVDVAPDARQQVFMGNIVSVEATTCYVRHTTEQDDREQVS
jgi:hypothetical protein